jgi:hypothetical protein
MVLISSELLADGPDAIAITSRGRLVAGPEVTHSLKQREFARIVFPESQS